ncbi:unnamed protein product [Cylicocyclus nassatus]|uniref:Uncharacterized protein n=1 Tax=Cylicocyclus nassatus TaxID=53992 RepID=A0AA36M3E2_CYLNA|nr:unnamed protein product [Cylicocyclus nassatus]
MVSKRRLAQVKKGKDVSGPAEAPSIEAESREQREEGMLLTKLHTILADKAPEALPLLNRLLNLVRQSASLELLINKKRSRSIVISGVPELNNGIASERQAHTEKSVISVFLTNWISKQSLLKSTD